MSLIPRSAVAAAAMACGAAACLGMAAAPSKASVEARSFVCSTAGGAPSTNVVTQGGQPVPLIRWTSSVFNDAGWTPQRRCQEVSGRFDTYFRQGRLDFITTGRMNGLPVICTARSYGGACDGLLFTLKPGQNATHTLQELFSIRTKARGPLNETNSRLYLSLGELVTNAQANASGAAAATTGPRLF
jgi:hypothetical protein